MSDVKAANLARIRDNQRRSRARRKEYLQELETKYRTCQQMGVEASAEVQTAARKVLDENKRLRSLLREKGVSDAEIDSYQQSQYDSDTSSTPVSSSLQHALHSRKACGPTSASNPVLVIPSDAHAAWGPCMVQNITTPTSATSTIPQQQLPLMPHSHMRTVELQQHSDCGSPIPSSPHSNVSPEADTISNYSHHSQFPNTPPEEDPAEPGTFPHLSYQFDPTPNSPWPMASATLPVVVSECSIPTMDYATTGAVYAANIITSMRPVVTDADMVADMASLHQQQMQLNCSAAMPNPIMYEVMGKYV